MMGKLLQLYPCMTFHEIFIDPYLLGRNWKCCSFAGKQNGKNLTEIITASKS